MPATFGDVYEVLCECCPDPRERGRRFEPLVQRVLSADKQYRDRFTDIWLWAEWPGRCSGDIGDGGLAAIQCKCYDPASTLYEQDVATFLAEHQRRLRRARDRQHHLQLEQEPAPAHREAAAAGATAGLVRAWSDSHRPGRLPRGRGGAAAAACAKRAATAPAPSPHRRALRP